MGSRPGYKIGKDEEGLTARDRTVLALLNAGHNQNAIAAQLGVHRQRVSQIKKKLITLGKYEEPVKEPAQGAGEG